VVHAFALAGGSGEERLELGKWLAGLLLCEAPDDGPCGECLSCRKYVHGNHEDFIHIKKADDKGSIVKDQILQLIDRLSFKPFGQKYVVLIEDAQLMNAASQNKLLKTLEEPVSDTVMILLSESSEGLLPTVLSRCCVFYLQDAEEGAVSAEKARAEEFLGLIIKEAPFYRKKAAVADIIADKENSRARAEAFLGDLEEVLIAKLKDQDDTLDELKAKRISEAIKHAETSRKYIKQLHSVGYSLKQMCLKV